MPDRWLGMHASRREEAAEKCEKKKITGSLQNFAVSLALLENWELPGLTGNPDRWDFAQVDLALISWVVNTVLLDFLACLNAPAEYYKRFGTGQAETAETSAPGS